MNHHQKWVTRTIKTSVLGLGLIIGSVSVQAASVSAQAQSPSAESSFVLLNPLLRHQSGVNVLSSQSKLGNESFNKSVPSGSANKKGISNSSTHLVKQGELKAEADYSYDNTGAVSAGGSAMGGGLSIDAGQVMYHYPLGTLTTKGLGIFSLGIMYHSDNNAQNIDGIGTGVHWAGLPSIIKLDTSKSSGNKTSYQLYVGSGAVARLGVNDDQSEVDFDDLSAAQSHYARMMITQCTKGSSLWDGKGCLLPVTDTSDGYHQYWQFSIRYRDAARVVYLGQSAEDDASDQTYYAPYGGNYKYHYYRTLLMVNSTVSTTTSATDSDDLKGSYINFFYQNEDYHGCKVDSGKCQDENYQIPVLTGIKTDTNASATIAIGDETIDDDSYDRMVTVKLAGTARTTALDYQTNSIANTGRPYPNRNLVKIVDQVTDPLDTQTHSYTTNLNYRYNVNDYAESPVKVVNASGTSYFTDAYSVGDTTLEKLTMPSGQTQLVNWYTSTVSGKNKDNGEIDTVRVDGPALCSTDNQDRYDGRACFFYRDKVNGEKEDVASFAGRPYAKSITASGVAYGGSSALTVIGESVVPSSNGGDSDQLTSYSNISGFPFITPFQHKEAPLWAIHDDPKDYETSANGKVPAPYVYTVTGQSAYTTSTMRTQYGIGPYLLQSEKALSATGMGTTTSYSYGNYQSAANLSNQLSSYDEPTRVLQTWTDENLEAGKTLQSQSTTAYTAIGDARNVQNNDLSQQVFEYNYDVSQEPLYYRLIDQVDLPYLGNGTDGQSYSPSGKKAYGYFSDQTVDNATGQVSRSYQGYVECYHSDGDYLNFCYGNGAGSYQTMWRNIGSIIAGDAGASGALTSTTLYRYDEVGRLVDEKLSVEDMSSTNAAPSVAMETSYDYLSGTASDLDTNLTSIGIDPNGLPTALSKNNSNTNYIANTVTGNADSSASPQWQAAGTQTRLTTQNRITGMVTGQFSGCKNATASTPCTFVNQTLVVNDALGFPREVANLTTDHLSVFSYSVGSGKNASTVTSYYCKDLTSLTANQWPLSSPGAANSGCEKLSQSTTQFNDFGQVSMTQVIHYQPMADNSDAGQIMKTSYNSYDFTENSGGGLLMNTTVYGHGDALTGKKLSVTTPLYNAAREPIGSMTTLLKNDDEPAAENGLRNYSPTGYSFNFSDPIIGRSYVLSFHPCSATQSDMNWCAKTMQVSQYQHVSTNSQEVYSLGSGRLMSQTLYHYDPSANSEGDQLSAGQIETLANGYATPQATQNLITELVAKFNDGIASNEWIASTQTNNQYDIYNRVTQAKVISGEGASKHEKVARSAYNDRGELIATSNATVLNVQGHSDSQTGATGLSQWTSMTGTAQDIVTTAMKYNLLGQVTDTVRYGDNPNSPIDFTIGQANGTVNFYREQQSRLNAFGQVLDHWRCGGTSYSGESCQALSEAGNTNSRHSFTNASYDALGRLMSYQDAKGTVFHRQYNSYGWLTSSWATAAAANETLGTCRSYDDATGELTHRWRQHSNTGGAFVCSSTPASDAMVYAYAPYTGELLSTSYPDGKVVSQSYDELGKLETMTDASGQYVSHYHYYLRSGLLAQVYWLSSNNGPVMMADSRYRYDEQNRLSAVSDSGVNVQSGYQQMGEHQLNWNEQPYSTVMTSSWIPASTDGLSQTFTQISTSDAWGLEQLVRNDSLGESDYNRDTLGRIIDDGSSASPVGYQYDVNGNLLKQTSQSNRHASWSVAALDTIDHQTNNSDQQLNDYAYDADGNVKADSKGCYTYDTLGELASFRARQTGDGKESCSGQTYSYSYYPDGLRATKSATIDGVSKLLKYYYTAGGAILNIAAYQNNQLQNMSHYFYGAEGKTAWLLTDANGQLQVGPTFLITGNAGNILGTFSDKSLAQYDAYGDPTQTAADIANSSSDPFDLTKIANAFHGTLYDAESDELYMPARTYSLTDKRFMQVDPVSSFNAYWGYDGDGMDNIDPSGSMSSKFWHSFVHTLVKSQSPMVGYSASNHTGHYKPSFHRPSLSQGGGGGIDAGSRTSDEPADKAAIPGYGMYYAFGPGYKKADNAREKGQMVGAGVSNVASTAQISLTVFGLLYGYFSTGTGVAAEEVVASVENTPDIQAQNIELESIADSQIQENIDNSQLSAGIIKRNGTFIGDGGEGSAYLYKNSVYKFYNVLQSNNPIEIGVDFEDIDNVPTNNDLAIDDAERWNTIYSRRGYKNFATAEAIDLAGEENKVLKSPYIEGRIASYEEALEANQRLRNIGFRMVDFDNPGNFRYSTILQQVVPVDMGNMVKYF